MSLVDDKAANAPDCQVESVCPYWWGRLPATKMKDDRIVAVEGKDGLATTVFAYQGPLRLRTTPDRLTQSR